MTETKNYCPNCKSYSGTAFEVVEEAFYFKNERIRCLKCQWVGYWDDCVKIEVYKHGS